MNHLSTAFSFFDDYNKQDPRTIVYKGEDYPAEYFYALQLHNWVKKLSANTSEALLLASRCQHIGRWQIPREQYPQTKAGYLTWRKELAKFHATKAGELLQQAGYNEDEIKAVQHILLKEELKHDRDVQIMEDALCLVFLQFQFEDFVQQHDEEKIIRILQKTWSKMSEAGREAALQLSFDEKAKTLLQKALQPTA